MFSVELVELVNVPAPAMPVAVSVVDTVPVLVNVPATLMALEVLRVPALAKVLVTVNVSPVTLGQTPALRPRQRAPLLVVVPVLTVTGPAICSAAEAATVLLFVMVMVPVFVMSPVPSIV